MIADYSERHAPSQQYTLGCVLIDGVINDVDDAVDAIVQTCKLPLSLVVVGVGPADFSSLVSEDMKTSGFCFLVLQTGSTM